MVPPPTVVLRLTGIWGPTGDEVVEGTEGAGRGGGGVLPLPPRISISSCLLGISKASPVGPGLSGMPP